jgi:restriction system protein
MKTSLETLSSPDTDDVSAALQLLGESLQGEVNRISREGSEAMQAQDFDTAQAVIDFARRLTAFRAKVNELGDEWLRLEELRDKASTEVQQIVSKRFFGKKKKGEITPHLDYCRSLLEVLEEMGGKGKTKEVLDRLGAKMKPDLKPIDFEIHESDGKTIRWRNAAQWARNTMVNDDARMKKSPRGIWEISPTGRAWLEREKIRDAKTS